MRRIFAGAPGALLIGLVACSTGPSTTGRVTFQLATSGALGAGATGPQAAVTVTNGANVLVISRVQLVARKIDFEQAEGSCLAPAVSSGSDSEGEQDQENDSHCPELRLGPMLLDPPITDGAESAFSVELPVGTYREMELQIHKPVDANGDAALLAAHPEFNGVSIMVDGTFNGVPFTFTTALTTKLEVEFDTPVEVVADGSTNVTLLMDVRGWFVGGGALLSPLALSQQSRAVIEQNIRASFHAFRDQNCDGHED